MEARPLNMCFFPLYHNILLLLLLETHKMVVSSKPAMDFSSYIKVMKPNFNPPLSTTSSPPQIPIIDLSNPDAKHLIVKACEDFGFFKVINHGVPLDFIARLESEAVRFFSLPLSDKEKVGPPNPFGYGNKKIGRNGDVGWVEYLLLRTDPRFNFHNHNLPSDFGQDLERFRYAPPPTYICPKHDHLVMLCFFHFPTTN